MSPHLSPVSEQCDPNINERGGVGMRNSRRNDHKFAHVCTKPQLNLTLMNYKRPWV